MSNLSLTHELFYKNALIDMLKTIMNDEQFTYKIVYLSSKLQICYFYIIKNCVKKSVSKSRFIYF